MLLLINTNRNVINVQLYFKSIGTKKGQGEIEINPWGGVEAIVSKLIANAINKPVAVGARNSPVF